MRARVAGRLSGALNLMAVRAEQARRRLYDFLRFAWAELEPGQAFEPGAHIEAICDHVQWQLEDRARAAEDPDYVMQVQNLLINIPPRCLKSRIVSVCATAWAWLRWPYLRILCLSANPRVSSRDADATRELIRSKWYQGWFAPAWKIREDKTALAGLGNTAGGFRAARGFDATITG